jgi:hypothetical protein
MAQLDPDERREELLRAPKADEADAAPRIETTEREGGPTRIDVADTAAVRPGDPAKQGGADAEA